MQEKPDGGGPVVIFAAVGMVLCCALPLLLLSGGLGAVTAWLFDGSGILLLFAGALALAAGGLFLRRRRGADASGIGPQTKSKDEATSNFLGP